MPEHPDTQDFELSYKSTAKSTPSQPMASFLSYLAFEGPGVRVGLELSACLMLYLCFSSLVPWDDLPMSEHWQLVLPWLLACCLVAAADQFLLFRPVSMYRLSYRSALSGGYNRALSLLERVSPNSESLIRCPSASFHLRRADILMYAAKFKEADDELKLAKLSGAPMERISIAHNRLLRAQGEFEKAEAELKAAREALGDTASLLLEEGLLFLEKNENLWTARRAFERVQKMPHEPHFSGESTRNLAEAYLPIALLWTGSAEEGIEGIQRSISLIRSAAFYADTLRPVLSLLHIEFAYYCATHKEPEVARAELLRGLSLCSYPKLLKRAQAVREELSWRYREES